MCGLSDLSRQHSAQPMSARQTLTLSLFSLQHPLYIPNDILVNDSDAQQVAPLHKLPRVLLAEALALTDAAPHFEVVHAFVEEVFQIAIDSLGAQAADRTSLLGKRVLQIVVERVSVHAESKGVYCPEASAVEAATG